MICCGVTKTARSSHTSTCTQERSRPQSVPCTGTFLKLPPPLLPPTSCISGCITRFSRAVVIMEAVGPVSSFREGEMRAVTLASGDEVMVVTVSGGWFAISNACVHKDASLSRGDIEDLGPTLGAAVGDNSGSGLCVKCPKHRRKFCGGLFFSLATGKSYIKGETSKYDPSWAQAVYRVEARSDGQVYVSSAAETAAVGQRKKRSRWEKFRSRIGGKGQDSTADESGRVDADGGDMFHSWSLTSVDRRSHDTVVYHFTARDGSPKARRRHTLTMQNLVSWHVAMRLQYVEHGRTKSVIREYTPISTLEGWEQGRMAILIKVYPDGVLTPRLAKLELGSAVDFAFPECTLMLPSLKTAAGGSHDRERGVGVASGAGGGAGAGSLELGPAPPADAVSSGPYAIGLVAGGTGVAPMWQLCAALFGKSNARARDFFPHGVQVSLLVSNRSHKDILLRLELNRLAAMSEGALTVCHTLTREVVDSWAGLCRRVDIDMLKRFMPSQEDAKRVVVSGPRGMWKTVSSALYALGYTRDQCTELEA